MHGHSFEVDIIVEGECDSHLGWLMDYGDISDRFQEFYKALDHKLLNDVEGIEAPTLEGIRDWLRTRLADRLTHFKDVIVRIRGCGRFEIEPAPQRHHDEQRVRFGFEAAHALPNLPPSHKCFNMHGHSFQIEVAAATDRTIAPWLGQVYDLLDHRCLNDIDGLENPTSEHVSRWIWQRLAQNVQNLNEVIVAETCTARCVYRGENTDA